MLSDAQMQQLKAQLENEQSELLTLLTFIDQSTQPVELDQNKVGRLSRMDAIQGQALAQASELRQRQRLNEIKLALTRLSVASSEPSMADYGRCQDCDDWIVFGRLQIDPAAVFCVSCAAAQEG